MDFSSSNFRNRPYLHILKVLIVNPFINHILLLCFEYGITHLDVGISPPFPPPRLVWILWILFFVVLNLFFFFKLLFTSYQLYEFGCPFRGFFFLQSQTSHYLFLCFHGPEALWFLNLSVISQAKVPLEDE